MLTRHHRPPGSFRIRPDIAALASATLGLAACVGAPQDDAAGSSAAITAGWDDDGDPAVVALMRSGAVTCSGTLIARDVVLTAAHCVDLLRPEEVITGADPASPAERARVRSVEMHPGFERSGLVHDIAVVVLDRALAAEPAELPRRDLDPADVGAAARLVGFGFPQAASEGLLRKRQGWTAIAALEDYRFQAAGGPSQPCLGDSGGPTFLQIDGHEPVVGVHSGGNADCTGGSFETRVDAHLEFLDPYSGVPYGRATGGGLTSGGCSVTSGASRSPGAGGAALGLGLVVAVGVVARRARSRSHVLGRARGRARSHA